MKRKIELRKIKERENLRNPNHPEKGRNIRVEPIRRIEDVNAIRELLSDKPRDLLLFTIGINNGLRVGDLLKLKAGEVRSLKEGGHINIREGKTQKNNVLMVNKSVYKALRNYFQKVDLKDDDFLFLSRKGNSPLITETVNAMVKRWTKAINLKGNYGAHTLRKTFGFIQRTKYGVSWEILAERFNHSTPAVTRRYLGITKEEVSKILLNEI